MSLRLLPFVFICAASVAAAELPREPLQVAREAAQKGDFPTAIKLLRAEADRGNAEAQNALGDLALAGRTGEASAVEALKWYQKAADASYPQAMFNLAALLSAGGKGVEKDSDKARFLLHAAAEAGNAGAEVSVGAAADAEGDLAEARRWYEKAAAQEHPVALLALARLTDRDGNAVKATELYFRSAQAGSAVAMNEIGVRYQQGTGLRQDPVAAVGWFTRAAQHRLAVAYANLGNCYESGSGVLQDFDKAGANYAAAAKLDYAPAQFLLAQLFESGKGTAVDLAKAYVLYTRAARGNVAAAGSRRAALKPKLSKAQLAEAEKLLAEDGAPIPAVETDPSVKDEK